VARTAFEPNHDNGLGGGARDGFALRFPTQAVRQSQAADAETAEFEEVALLRTFSHTEAVPVATGNRIDTNFVKQAFGSPLANRTPAE
jgi:hypothetical protein